MSQDEHETKDSDREPEDAEDDETDSIPLSELRADIETDVQTPPRQSKADQDIEKNNEEDSDEPAEERANSIPLSGLRDDVSERTESPSTSTGEDQVDGTFVEEEVESLDSEGLWADLLMEDSATEGEFSATSTERTTDGVRQIISKRICERCMYVDDPPTLRCTHDGTDILELVDVDHVRVSNCPMVGPEGEKRSEGPQPPEPG